MIMYLKGEVRDYFTKERTKKDGTTYEEGVIVLLVDGYNKGFVYVNNVKKEYEKKQDVFLKVMVDTYVSKTGQANIAIRYLEESDFIF